jgi:hypothetical protein
MWIEVESKNLMVNLDTGTRIEIFEPNASFPYAIAINMLSLAYFKDWKDALAAFDSLRKLIRPEATVAFVGVCEAPDPFKMLRMHPKERAVEIGLAGGQDWISKAKDLGVEPEQGR